MHVFKQTGGPSSPARRVNSSNLWIRNNKVNSFQMEEPESLVSLCLFQETRIDLEPTLSDSIVHIALPSTTAFGRPTRTRRRIENEPESSKDEEEFKSKHIATFGSVYFRTSKRYPKCILWRCLEKNQVLELRSVDLDKARHEAREAALILRIEFPIALQDDGVALADTETPDIITIFALTTSNELYTFSIRPDFFCRATASDVDVATWSRIFRPVSFTLSSAHRLFAPSANDIIVTLIDGRLLRLTKKAGEDGSSWVERALGDSQWGSSLRGLIKWQGNNTVTYRGNVLEQDTAVSASTSPDRLHLFTVCLNHTLKAWNIKNGKLAFSKDLLDVTRDPQKPRIMLSPNSPGLLQLFEAQGAREGDRYYALTFSPQESGIFKFWAIRDADHPGHGGVRDLYPENVFKMPDPNDGAMWTMAGFHLKPAYGGQGMELWVLIRLNRRYQLNHRKLDLLNLPDDWNRDWLSTAVDVTKNDDWNQTPSTPSPQDAECISEKWLDHIMSPGRLPKSVLETALTLHCQARQLVVPDVKRNPSLRSRIASSIGSSVALDSSQTDLPDVSKFQEELHRVWSDFWSDALEIDRLRWEPLSLGLSTSVQAPWIIFGDGCSVIHECNPLDILQRNNPEELQQHANHLELPSIEVVDDESSRSRLPEELCLLIQIAARFRSSFSNSLALACRQQLSAELWQEPSYSNADRLALFFEKCGFEHAVSDKDYHNLDASLKAVGGMADLDSRLILGILNRLPRLMSQEASGLQSTRFGLKYLSVGASATIAMTTQILTDLLLLVVFLAGEEALADTTSDDSEWERNFRPNGLYKYLIEQLKIYQMMEWLATHSRPDPQQIQEKLNSLDNHLENDTSTRHITTPRPVSTIISNLFAKDTSPQSYSSSSDFISASQISTLTSNISDLLVWTSGGNDPSITLSDVLVHIQANLLKNNDIQLASDFLRFQPYTAWGMYMRGRLLLRNEPSEASICFRKAAVGLSQPSNPPIAFAQASSSLLSPLDASYLATGLSNYYTHILTLFSAFPAREMYIQSFARLALLHTAPTNSAHLNAANQQADLLTRLFHASLALGDYNAAYSALARYSDHALRKAGVGQLISSLVQRRALALLTEFPWSDSLAIDADQFLEDRVSKDDGSGGSGGIGSVGRISCGESVGWYKVLYAFRTRRGDLKGAAEVLVGKVAAQRKAKFRKKGAKKVKIQGSEKEREEREEGDYLLALNALAVLGGSVGVGNVGRQGTTSRITNGRREGQEMVREDDRAQWVFVGGNGQGQRCVVRLRDLKEWYAGFLDEKSVLEQGRFGILEDGEEMETD